MCIRDSATHDWERAVDEARARIEAEARARALKAPMLADDATDDEGAPARDASARPGELDAERGAEPQQREP